MGASKKNCRNRKYSFLQRKKKTKRKLIHRVVIKEINKRTNSGPVSISRSSQFHVVGNRRMADNEHPSNDILT